MRSIRVSVLDGSGEDLLIAALAPVSQPMVALAPNAQPIVGLAPTAQPMAPAAVVPVGRSASRSVRLNVDLLDHMMSGMSEMVLARNELARRLRDSDDRSQGRGGAGTTVADCGRHARHRHPDPDAESRRAVFGATADGARYQCGAVQGGQPRDRGRRCRARPRDDRADARPARPYHPQFDRPRDRDADGTARGG